MEAQIALLCPGADFQSYQGQASKASHILLKAGNGGTRATDYIPHLMQKVWI